MKHELQENNYEAVIVGGSFAGMAAALQLGRAGRQVAVIDSGLPRNRFAQHSHGFLTQDGKAPADILKEARQQLSKYPTVSLVSEKAIHAEAREGQFQVQTEEGSTLLAKRLLLAYGLQDKLPEIPGLQERSGKSVFHCPYCHGYEVRDLPLGLYGSGELAVHAAVLLRDWSDSVTLFLTEPDSLDEEALAKLEKRKVQIERVGVKSLIGQGDDLSHIELMDSRQIPIQGLLVAPISTPAASLHQELGCETVIRGNNTILLVDEKKQTTVPGIFAAGDLARSPHSVSLAVGDGFMAGVACHQSLLTED